MLNIRYTFLTKIEPVVTQTVQTKEKVPGGRELVEYKFFIGNA